MSLRNRIEQIAAETATNVARVCTNNYTTSTTVNQVPMVTVLSVDGINVTISLPDGTQKTVPNGSDRNIGYGDTGLLAGGMFFS